MTNQLDPSKQLYLRDTQVKTLVDALNTILEYFVFFRWIYFKNRPRGNFLLIRSALLVTFLGSLYYVFFSSLELIVLGLDVDPVIVFSFAIVLGYWMMISGFYSKSSYCAQLYSDYFKEVGSGNDKSALLIKVNLAIHLLAVDLWGHRSFSDLFIQALNQAVQNTYSAPEERDKFFKQASSGELEIGAARNILKSYQRSLIDN